MISSRRWLMAAAAFVAAAVYVNTLANGFALDDVYIIELNSRAHDPADLRSVWLTPYWPFLGQELGLYRPAAIFMYAIQWVIGGGAPWVYHAVSVALHVLVTVLVFVLLERLTDRVPAFVGALVFAVHPVHVEAVANVVGQAEILAAAAILAACLLHSGRPPGVSVSWPRRLTLVVLFLLALCLKESAVVLPALLVITDIAQRRVQASVRAFAKYADGMLMPLFLLTATLACYLLVRFDVMGGSITGVDAAPSVPYLREEYRVLNALRAFPEFLRLLVFPKVLASDYLPAVLLPVESVQPMVVLGAAMLVTLTGMALLTPWLPAVGFPAAWFLISIITVSNLFFPIGVLVAERTLYLPSIAFSALLAFAWQWGDARMTGSGRRVVPVLLLVAVVLLGARTWIRNPDWRTTSTVLQAHVRDHPLSYRAQWSQAATFRSLGNHEIAELHYRMADRIYPRDAQFLAEYGDFLFMRGRVPEAVDLLERAYALQPNLTRIVTLLSQAYLAATRYHDSLDMTLRAERLGVDINETMPLRAAAYAGIGDHGRASAAWRIVIRQSNDPNWQMWAFLGRELASQGLVRDAAAAIESARSATTDSAALDIISRTAAAVADGCYAPAAANDRRAVVPDCDPLRHWIGLISRSGPPRPRAPGS